MSGSVTPPASFSSEPGSPPHFYSSRMYFLSPFSSFTLYIQNVCIYTVYIYVFTYMKCKSTVWMCRFGIVQGANVVVAILHSNEILLSRKSI